jgi:hypothetical protein
VANGCPCVTESCSRCSRNHRLFSHHRRANRPNTGDTDPARVPRYCHVGRPPDAPHFRQYINEEIPRTTATASSENPSRLPPEKPTIANPTMAKTTLARIPIVPRHSSGRGMPILPTPLSGAPSISRPHRRLGLGGDKSAHHGSLPDCLTQYHECVSGIPRTKESRYTSPRRPLTRPKRSFG